MYTQIQGDAIFDKKTNKKTRMSHPKFHVYACGDGTP